MKSIGLILVLLTAIGAETAIACQQCHQKVTRECVGDPKHPVCHDVITCTGGTCGDESVTIFKNTIFNDAEISQTVLDSPGATPDYWDRQQK